MMIIFGGDLSVAIKIETLGDILGHPPFAPLNGSGFEDLVAEVVAARETELATPQALTGGPVIGIRPMRAALGLPGSIHPH